MTVANTTHTNAWAAEQERFNALPTMEDAVMQRTDDFLRRSETMEFMYNGKYFKLEATEMRNENMFVLLVVSEHTVEHAGLYIQGAALRFEDATSGFYIEFEVMQKLFEAIYNF